MVTILYMATLSTTDKNRLQHAIDSMVKENATEIPFDATVIEELARVSASSGFESAGNFKQDARDRPISTLVRWIKYMGT